MLQRNFKNLLMGAVVVAGALVADTPQAEAFWGHSSGGSYGSWGSSGGYYGSSGGSSGGYYAYGSWGGGHHRHHHRRAYYGSSGGWGSSGGSYGSWGSSGGSYGSWGSSGGYVGGAVITTPPAGGAAPPAPGYAPTTPPPYPGDMPQDQDNVAPPPGPDENAPPGLDNNPPEDGAVPPEAGAGLYRRIRGATLTVRVPADAKVFVNGLATTSTGTFRRYVSNGLRPGLTYAYEVRAEIIRGGQPISETKTVRLQAGDVSDIEFAMNGSNDESIASEPVRTSLTLHVPADAKVYLSGKETRGFGETRVFSTTKLSPGEQWANYVVRVEVQRDGQTLSQEETVDLSGGETRELTIAFDAPQVARIGG